MKIGIVTYVKCDNYGAELQAYAMQYVYNSLDMMQKSLTWKSKTKILPHRCRL